MITIPATYDYRLVALSVLIAIFASYAALDLAGRVTRRGDQARSSLAVGAANCHGHRHLVHALHRDACLPPCPCGCTITFPQYCLSLLAAIFASFVALYVVSRRRVTTLHVMAGSVLMGAGIAAMPLHRHGGHASGRASSL